jgi:hypothetical protein
VTPTDLTCGVDDLDTMLRGWRRGTVVAVTAEAGHGASTFVAQLARETAAPSRPVLLVSGLDDRVTVAERLSPSPVELAVVDEGTSLASVLGEHERADAWRLLVVDDLDWLADDLHRDLAQLRAYARGRGATVVVTARRVVVDDVVQQPWDRLTDAVVHLHRPDRVDVRDRPGEVVVDVVRNRMGPTGSLDVCFLAHRLRYAPFAPPRSARTTTAPVPTVVAP